MIAMHPMPDSSVQAMYAFEAYKNKTKLFVFDCEADGLYGYAFAFGAAFWDGSKWKTFSGIDVSHDVTDLWVKQNVIPHTIGLTQYQSGVEMRSAFWGLLQEAKKAGASIWADVGCPVEAGFIRQCEADDKSRLREGPYPLHEIATLLLASGVDPDAKRIDLLSQAGYRGDPPLTQHNPEHDALIGGYIALFRLWMITKRC
jgi:hypothetical protein